MRIVHFTTDLPAMTARQEIAALLRDAARMLDRHPAGGRDGGAAWRVADAGLMLRGVIEAEGTGDGGGIGTTHRTGLGALLPREARPVDNFVSARPPRGARHQK